MGPILGQIPLSPMLGRIGEDRSFTYEFGDGSRLVLGARWEPDRRTVWRVGLVLRGHPGVTPCASRRGATRSPE